MEYFGINLTDPLFNVESYSEILPNVYIGNFAVSKSKKFILDHNIQAMVNVTSNLQNTFNRTIDYYRIPVDDIANDYNINIYKSHIDKALQFIRDRVRNNKSVLIYCQMGISRSATLIALYLIEYYGYDLNNAIRIIRNKRPITFYNGNSVIFKKLFNI